MYSVPALFGEPPSAGQAPAIGRHRLLAGPGYAVSQRGQVRERRAELNADSVTARCRGLGDTVNQELRRLVCRVIDLQCFPRVRRGVTAVAWLAVPFAVVSTGYALANPNPDAFGPHNFADYTAIVILLAGAVAWLLHRFLPHAVVSEAPRRRPRTAADDRPVEQRSADRCRRRTE